MRKQTKKQIEQIDVSRIEGAIGYTFRNKSILKQSFIRSSLTEEEYSLPNNEELEFIGDSFLSLLVTKLLAERFGDQFWDMDVFTELKKKNKLSDDEENWIVFETDESELSELRIRLVKSETLASAIDKLGLSVYLCVSQGDEKNGIRDNQSVKEDLFEAILGAVAIDSGWSVKAGESVLDNMLKPDEFIECGFQDEPDYIKLFTKWYERAYGKEIKLEASKNERDEYGCYIDLGFRMHDEAITSLAKTEKGAKRLAAKRAFEYVNRVNTLAKRVIDAVGEPKYETAINQLQELYQKKIIPKPTVTVRELLDTRDKGNPYWECTVEIPELGIKRHGSATNKTEAKKTAMLATLKYLLGFKIKCSYCDDDDRVYEITDMDYYDFLNDYIKEHPECVIKLDEEY